MGAEHGIGAVGAAVPLIAPDPVTTLRDDAASALPLPVASTPAPPTEIAQLSTTGKLLAALLQTSAPAAPVTQAAPLLATPNVHAPVIAEAIRSGIEHSGLFYESHLANWVSGQHEFDALALEPQARAGNADELPAILRQQLEMLDSQPLQWRGELWPGMPLQLQVDRQPAEAHGGAGDETPDIWNTTLVSELPALGSVTVKLRLDGDRLQLKLQAGDSASLLLAQRSAELRDALTAAGLQLQRFDADGERSA